MPRNQMHLMRAHTNVVGVRRAIDTSRRCSVDTGPMARRTILSLREAIAHAGPLAATEYRNQQRCPGMAANQSRPTASR